MTHILERFDPYEVFVEDVDIESLDEYLQILFQRIDPDFIDLISPPNISYLKRTPGLQLQQQNEGEETEMDPGGFCQPWTFIYAQIRLSYPNQNPKKVPDTIKKWVAASPKSLTSFIRSYSYFLLQQSEIIFSDAINHTELSRFKDPRVLVLMLIIQRMPQ